MSTDPLEEIKRLLPLCSAQAKRELFTELRRENPIHGLEGDWNVTAEVVLEAIARSSDLTQRMFRGILAEAACKVEVIDKLEGWTDVTKSGNFAYDFRVEQGGTSVSIQAKLQRKLNGVPWTANRATGLVNPEQFVVEVQKTRAGEGSDGSSTRPYRFGEFDIIAVAMEPSTGNWSQFRFTLGRWLIPRASDATLIQIYQPVSLKPDDDWTDNLATALEWHKSGIQKTIRGGADPNTPKKRTRKG